MISEEKTKMEKEIERLKSNLVSKRKEIKIIKTTNLFMETLFNGISEEIMVIDNDFNIIDVNKAFLERCGLKKPDVIGRKCGSIKERPWAPCARGDIICPVEHAAKSGETVQLSHLYKDPESGGTKEFTTIVYPLKDEGSDIKYFLEISRDVTEYRHLIMKLQRSEKRFRAILDTATDAIISLDENHEIILFNDAAQRIFGYSGKEVLGRDLRLLIPSQHNKNNKNIRRFLEKKDSDIFGKTISLKGARNGGEIFPIELSLSFMELEESVLYTAIIRDTTEQEKIKSKMLHSERLAAVGRAVAHVAHEIKNPLMIIGGFSSQIKSHLENEKDRHKLDMVLEEVARLERMVADLGDLTREYKLVKRPAHLNSVINDVIQIMTGACDQERYIFKKKLSEEIEEIECDPDKLKQVFINIISNGIEAMQSGGSIFISTEIISNGVEIRIADEGIGIDPDKLQNLFVPFYTTRNHGWGLGLPISYKLIEAHNGDIWALSTPGKGTTFVIQLPSS
ncbi:MAG: PAS domain S-box protein [Deltaproteobacteria bacterium]|nr:PAS domain S-box protein [Deltaproteobacteria bacterium]